MNTMKYQLVEPTTEQETRVAECTLAHVIETMPCRQARTHAIRAYMAQNPRRFTPRWRHTIERDLIESGDLTCLRWSEPSGVRLALRLTGEVIYNASVLATVYLVGVWAASHFN